MRRTLILLTILALTSLRGVVAEDLEEVIDRAICESPQGQLLLEELRYQRMSIYRRYAAYHPYVKTEASYTEGEDFAFSYYKYVFATSSDTQETMQKLRNRTPSAEVALVKKFCFGGEVEVFTGVNQLYTRAKVMNAGDAQTTLLDNNAMYRMLSDVLSTDYGVRFSWPLLGREAAKNYSFGAATCLELQRSMLRVKMQADAFVAEVAATYHDLCRARWREQHSRRLHKLTEQLTKDSTTSHEIGDASVDELAQASMINVRAASTLRRDQMELCAAEQHARHVLGFVPTSCPSLDEAESWSFDTCCLPCGDEVAATTSVATALARVERCLAELDYETNCQGDDSELVLDAEARRVGFNNSHGPGKNDFENVWSVTLSYSSTFNYCQRKLDKAMDRSAVRRAQINEEQTCRQVIDTVLRLTNQMEWISEEYTTELEALRLARKDLAASKERFDMGQVPRNVVIRSEQATLNQASIVMDLYFEALSLEVAIGREIGDVAEYMSESLGITEG